MATLTNAWIAGYGVTEQAMNDLRSIQSMVTQIAQGIDVLNQAHTATLRKSTDQAELIVAVADAKLKLQAMKAALQEMGVLLTDKAETVSATYIPAVDALIAEADAVIGAQ